MKYVSLINIGVFAGTLWGATWECDDIYCIYAALILVAAVNFTAFFLNFYKWKIIDPALDPSLAINILTASVFVIFFYVVAVYVFFYNYAMEIPCHVHILGACGLSTALHLSGMNLYSIQRYLICKIHDFTKSTTDCETSIVNYQFYIAASTQDFLRKLEGSISINAIDCQIIKCFAYTRTEARKAVKHFVDIGYEEYTSDKFQFGKCVFVLVSPIPIRNLELM